MKWASSPGPGPEDFHFGPARQWPLRRLRRISLEQSWSVNRGLLLPAMDATMPSLLTITPRQYRAMEAVGCSTLLAPMRSARSGEPSSPATSSSPTSHRLHEDPSRLYDSPAGGQACGQSQPYCPMCVISAAGLQSHSLPVHTPPLLCMRSRFATRRSRLTRPGAQVGMTGVPRWCWR